jgi:hypothetical protein
MYGRKETVFTSVFKRIGVVFESYRTGYREGDS